MATRLQETGQRPGVTDDENRADTATAVTWPCGHCGEPVTGDGSSPPGYPRHVATGYETCQDESTRATPDPRQCAHDPEPGTVYTTTGLPADLRRKYDYPADAKCTHCGQWVRCPELGGPWGLKYPEHA